MGGGTVKPGDRMPDGTVYAGVSPDTGDAMYVTPKDAPRAKFEEAARSAATLDAYGHADWRLPTVAELQKIYKNRYEGALKGTFNETSGSGHAHWYWSGTEDRDFPSVFYFVDFADDFDACHPKDCLSLSSRPVRTEPRP